MKTLYWERMPPFPTAFDPNNFYGSRCVWALIPGWGRFSASGATVRGGFNAVGRTNRILGGDASSSYSPENARFDLEESGTGGTKSVEMSRRNWAGIGRNGVGFTVAAEIDYGTSGYRFAYKSNDLGPPFPNLDNFTVITVFVPFSTTNDMRIFAKDSGSSTNAHDLMLGSSGTRARTRVRMNSVKTVLTSSGGPYLTTDRINVIATSVAPDNSISIQLLNGNFEYTEAIDSTASSGYSPRNTTDIAVGSVAGTAGGQFDGHILGVWFLDGCLRGEHHLRYFRDGPWRTFQPIVLPTSTVVSAGTDRTVTCSTATVGFTEAASVVNRARGVSCSTEQLSITEAAASINRSRGVLGQTASVGATSNAATANTSRGVSGTTEQISVAEIAAIVTRAKNVVAATEQISYTTPLGTVNASRIVSGAPVSISITENQGVVNRSRVVGGATEQISITESLATIGRGKFVTGITEAVLVTVNSSTVNRARGVVASTEQVSVAETAANINRSRALQAPTEQVSITENTATVNASRIAAGATEAISVTANPSVLNRSRKITSPTEQISITENSATISKGRALAALTEAVSVTSNPSTVNTSRKAGGQTEAIGVAVNIGAVNRSRAVVCSTEDITIALGAGSVTTSRNVNAATEQISIFEQSATIVRPGDTGDDDPLQPLVRDIQQELEDDQAEPPTRVTWLF